MTGKLLSASWYRVVALKPRLRDHVRLHRHRYRGQVWYVMADPVTGRTHRFTLAARLILNGMDGHRTVGDLWEIANRRLGESAPTQDDLISLLGQLHSADLMQCDVSPDISEMFLRAQRQERVKTKQSFGNPMAIKVPVFDPDKLLDRLAPFVSPFWNRWGALAWLAVVLPALLMAMLHWSDLTSNVSDSVMASHNLFMLALLFPLIKILHEMGHAIATKMRGGEVHEMGVMFLMLMPIPYVDATAATTFRNRMDRALVGAAGMLVEVFIAALAMYLWLLLEPGLLRSVAFNTMLVAGVSTVIFNGNPLLRFDGYYILADLIEIPNLGIRANRYIGYLVEHYIFRAKEAQPPEASSSEKAWFSFYAPVSFVYRTIVTIGIIFFIASEFFLIGVLLAIWTFVMAFFMPLVRMTGHLVSSPTLRRVRTRAYLTTAAALSILLFFIVYVPMPFYTEAEGVVWLPEQALVRTESGGFVSHLMAQPGGHVLNGVPLVKIEDPTLEAQVQDGKAKVAEHQARLNALFVDDRVAAEVARKGLEQEQTSLLRLQERLKNLIVYSPGEGRFVAPQADDMPGRFFRKGELLGYVLERVKPIVRVVVEQDQADLVRWSTQRIEMRNAHRINDVIIGTVMRDAPGGLAKLPSRALTKDGGGQFAVNPHDSQGMTSLKNTFQLDIDLPSDTLPLYGGRVYVRFEHIPKPLGYQWYRRIRSTFLSHFNV